ncbi:hypothetical protein BJ878DRAFT_561329 [Calycina marina]|uniref:Uncharacterized protein n=1 Tax=Calycina marina TaxID=1763456 RepID=A0A9P8CB98_9HELO|nr:hypothetical protein BJ878DRAFT_561329 [Calycina marina]
MGNLLADRLNWPCSQHQLLTDWRSQPTRRNSMGISGYRKDPSPEVNEEWLRFEDIRSYILSKDDVVKLGKDPDTIAKYENDYGFWEEKYIGQMDVFHQIHCLDLMRVAIFALYWGPSEIVNGYMCRSLLWSEYQMNQSPT